MRNGWILTRKLSGKDLKTRTNPALMKCWPLRKRRSGNMPPRRQPMSRPRRILWNRPGVYGEPEKMTVLVVEPLKEPHVKQIDPGYKSMQAEVDGTFQAIYPYDDPVAR